MSQHNKYFQGSGYEEVYVQILRALLYNAEFSSDGRDGKQYRETPSLSFEIWDPRNRFVWNAARAANYEFAMKMFIWIINGCDDFAYVGGSNPNAKKFIDASTEEERQKATFNTAYGPRIKEQLEDVLGELIRSPGSRRATIMILKAEDAEIRRADTRVEYPCAESLTFFIRDGALHLHAQMRSNNMYTTVVYDVFVFTMLQEYIYEFLRRNGMALLKLGRYFHHCTSAHLFEEDLERVELALECADVAMIRPEVKG